MPQLDNLIVLPQIFWFIIFFSLFYFLVAYYFLPIMLRSTKFKKYFLDYNYNLNVNLSKEILKKREILLNIVLLDFFNIKTFIFDKVLNLQFNFKQDFFFRGKRKKLINILLFAFTNSILYCNTNLLKSLKLFPSILNKKINK